MPNADLDSFLRMAAFEHVRRLGEVHDHLTAADLKPGFIFRGERIPLINPQSGIFKPQQMRFLLSIKTVFQRPGSSGQVGGTGIERSTIPGGFQEILRQNPDVTPLNAGWYTLVGTFGFPIFILLVPFNILAPQLLRRPRERTNFL